MAVRVNPGLSRIRGSLLVPGGGDHLVVEEPEGRTWKVSGACGLAGSFLVCRGCRAGAACRPAAGAPWRRSPGRSRPRQPCRDRTSVPCSTFTRSTVVAAGSRRNSREPGSGCRAGRHARAARCCTACAVATAATCGSLVERGEVGRVEPAEQDGHLAGAGPGQQPRIGGVGAPRARRRGEDYAAGQPEQQREADQRPPPAPHPGAQREPDRCHGQHSTGRPGRRARGEVSRGGWCCPHR